MIPVKHKNKIILPGMILHTHVFDWLNHKIKLVYKLYGVKNLVFNHLGHLESILQVLGFTVTYEH